MSFCLREAKLIVACGHCSAPLPLQKHIRETSQPAALMCLTHVNKIHTWTHIQFEGSLLQQSQTNSGTLKPVLSQRNKRDRGWNVQKKPNSWICNNRKFASGTMGGSGSLSVEIQIRMPNDSAILGGVTPGAKQTSCYGSAQHGTNLSLTVTAELWAQWPCKGYK